MKNDCEAGRTPFDRPTGLMYARDTLERYRAAQRVLGSV